MAIASLIFSMVVAASCEFIVVEIDEGSNTANSTSLNTSLTYGQFRFNPDGEGCRKFSSDDYDVTWELVAGQVGLLLATGTSSFLLCSLLFCFACAFRRHSLVCPFLRSACLIVIFVLLLLQFCCCRFCCSRGIMIVLFILAIIGMSVTFLTYASNLWYVHDM
jgi:hypothetical protein